MEALAGICDAVLVAIDGSATAEAAVDWAASQAVAHGRTLLVLTAVNQPASSEVADSIAEFGGSASLKRVRNKARRREEHAREILRQTQERVVARFPTLHIETLVFSGHPQDALREHASRACLTVIGSRGLGPLRSRLLGSVGLWATRHIEHPLAVVRPAGRRRLGTQCVDPTCKSTLMMRPSEANLREDVWGRQMDAALEGAHGVTVVVLPAQSALWDWFAETCYADSAREALSD